jgi:carbon monoxide dehydrogenase subunit G
MEMSGERRIAAGRKQVWAALNNPSILKQCIPGCEELQSLSPTDMVARVKLQIGPVKATFNGKVLLNDLDPPNGYRIVGEGSGGVAGRAARLRYSGQDAVSALISWAASKKKIEPIVKEKDYGTARKPGPVPSSFAITRAEPSGAPVSPMSTNPCDRPTTARLGLIAGSLPSCPPN